MSVFVCVGVCVGGGDNAGVCNACCAHALGSMFV